jgi:hypothetical protein
MLVTWWENPFLTTTTTQFEMGRPGGGIERYRDSGDGMSDRECE